NAADRAFAQRFAPRAEKLSRAPACATVELPCAFDEPGAIEQAAEVLFVQGEAGNGFDDALQMQQRELLRRQFEHDGAIFDLGAWAPEGGRQDAPVVGGQWLAEARFSVHRRRWFAIETRPIARRFGCKASFVEQFIALQRALFVPDRAILREC